MKGISRHIAIALLAGLALRLVFVLHFPAADDDSAAYIELAHNLVDHHVYGLYLNGVLTPLTYRMPGYPLFLAGVYLAGGKSQSAIGVAQIAVDLGTCGLIMVLAWSIAPAGRKRAVVIGAAWLAALCPFVANYNAVVLSEVLATFWTAGALVAIAWALGADVPEPISRLNFSMNSWWLLAGLCVGAGTLMRPETPLLLAGCGAVLAYAWRRRGDLARLARAVVLLAVGLVIPLTPWTMRNWVTFHKFLPLVPQYPELPGEFATRGFIAWTKTWLVHYDELDQVPFKIGREPIKLSDLPKRAFDSGVEQHRVEQLLRLQSVSLGLTPEIDREFGELATERAARHPLRTYFLLPIRRIGTIWLTARVELLPYSGEIWPPWEKAGDEPTDFSVAACLWTVNAVLLVLCVIGIWRSARNAILAVLVVFIVTRTVFFAWIHFTPEPRFVLECFPAVTAVAALGLRRRDSR